MLMPKGSFQAPQKRYKDREAALKQNIRHFFIMDQNEDTNKSPRIINHGQWYWIPKALIRNHAIKIGPIGIAVYNVLASMTDKDQKCFPSQKYIADSLGYSRATINKALKALKAQGLISVKRRNRYNLSYQLIEPRCKPEEIEMSTRRNRDVNQGNTNNNQLRRINNNIVWKEKLLRYAGPRKAKNYQSKTREELVASDIASGLKDSTNIHHFIELAKKYPESLLRRALSEAREMPDNKIKKSRTALFNYLIKEYTANSSLTP
jgi:biotin operon repressor